MASVLSIESGMAARPGYHPASARAAEAQLAAVEQELSEARGELDLLRRRDGAINLYMSRVDEEMRLAARLQRDFLPKQLPAVGPARFHAMWRPAGYVSGDLYDVIRLDEAHVGLYIADAVGHGVSASLLAMFVRHALATKDVGAGTYRLLDPGDAMTRLNASLIAQELTAGTFCTACYGVLDTRTLELRLAGAGHPPPFLLRGEEPPRPLRCDGPLLGIFEGERFATTSHQLAPGDRLLLYTDGMEVAFNDDRHPTSARWQDELFRRRRLGGQELLEDLAGGLDGEAGSLDPRDDLTLVVMEVL